MNDAERMADELFFLVQYDQGKAFISDGMDCMKPSDIISAARSSLRRTERVARRLRRWLGKYEDLCKE